MQNNQNRILIPIIVLSLVIGGFYYVGQQQVKESVALLELHFSDFRVSRLSLIPPEIDIIILYTVTNPSELSMEMSMDGAIYYGETQITPITVSRRRIPANGNSEIEAQISLNGTLLQVIGDPENIGNYSLEGSLTVTSQYMGLLPISIELDLAELESES
jgi:hypothetical protein